VGIAVTQTLLAHFRQGQTNILGSHVSSYDSATRMALDRLRHLFVIHGSHPVTATRETQAMVWGMVEKQAAMIAYIDVFRVLTLLFLLVIPFVFLLKKPVHQTKPAAPVAE